jgi:hypothetical protein
LKFKYALQIKLNIAERGIEIEWQIIAPKLINSCRKIKTLISMREAQTPITK